MADIINSYLYIVPESIQSFTISCYFHAMSLRKSEQYLGLKEEKNRGYRVLPIQ